MRRAAALIGLVLLGSLGAAALPSFASAGYCTSTPSSPICLIEGGTASPTTVSNFDAAMNPTTVYTPPTGAPTNWSGTANGAIWEGMEVAGTAPAASSFATSIAGGIVGSVAGYAAFQTGLYIGGTIAKRFIFQGYNPGTPSAPLATTMDTGWAWTYYRSESTNQYCGPSTNVPYGDWCIKFTTGSSCSYNSSVPSCYYNGFVHQDYKDVGICGSYTNSASTEGYNGSVCGFTDDISKSLAITEYTTMQNVLTSASGQYWHVRNYLPPGGGTPHSYGTLQVYTTGAEFARYLSPALDSAHSTAQPGDAVISSFTPTTQTSTTRANGATTITNIYDSGDPAGKAAVDRMNCQMDVTYCPGGANYPNNIMLLQPLTNETYSAYLSRLQANGYVGTATTTQESTDLSGYGPLAVTRLVDGTTTTVYDPLHWPTSTPLINSSGPLTIRYNSSSSTPAPTTGTTGTSTCGSTGSPCVVTVQPSTATPGSLDLSPITGVDFGCQFPFGLFCYATTVTGWFNVTPTAPDFTFSLPGFNVGGTSLTSSNTYDVSLSNMDGYMSIIRAILAVAVYIGAAWMLASRLLNLNVGDPGEAVDDGMPG